MRVPPVDSAPLADLVAGEPTLQVERIGAVARLAEQVSFSRVLLGSNYPLYYFESALLKVQESGLTEAEAKAVFEENARRLMAR